MDMALYFWLRKQQKKTVLVFFSLALWVNQKRK